MKNGKLTAYGAPEVKTLNSTTLKFSISREVRLNLLSDKANLWSLVASLSLIATQASVIGYYFQKLPPQIPLLYSTTWGDTMMTRNIFVFLLPIIATSFVFLNLILYFLFFRDNKFLARVLFVSCAIVGFCTFWGSLKIVTLLG